MKKKIVGMFKNAETIKIYRGMLTLVAGSLSAQVVGLASIPIVTRIYSPEDFGMLALFVSFVTVMAPFLSLKYSAAIPLPKADATAINLLALTFLLICVLATASGLVLLLFGQILFASFGAQELAQWSWLMILAVAGTASYESLCMWSTRKKQYSLIAKTHLGQSLIGNTTKIILGLLGLKPFGLVFGQFLVQSSGGGALLKGAWRDINLNSRSVSLKRIKFVAFYYRQFAYFRMPSQLLLSLSAQAPILMMASLFGTESTGQLSLAMMAIALPTSLIGSAMARAFYAEVAHIGKNDLPKIKRVTIAVQKKLFLIGAPIAALAMLLAEPMFGLIFGSGWDLAGRYAAILAPYILLQFTSNPLIQVLNIVGSQLIFLAINIIRVAGLVLLFIVLKVVVSSNSSELFVVAVSSYLTLYYLLMTVFIIYMVSGADRARRKC